MAALVLFTADWASPICGPYRAVVSSAAGELGWELVEADIDSEPTLAQQHGLLTVPSVGLLGAPELPLIVGAIPASALVALARERFHLGE